MDKVEVRVIGRPILKTQPGDTVRVSPRDARILASIGRVELVEDRARKPVRQRRARSADHDTETEVEFTPSERLETALEMPEAELATVAHTTRNTPRKRHARKRR